MRSKVNRAPVCLRLLNVPHSDVSFDDKICVLHRFIFLLCYLLRSNQLAHWIFQHEILLKYKTKQKIHYKRCIEKGSWKYIPYEKECATKDNCLIKHKTIQINLVNLHRKKSIISYFLIFSHIFPSLNQLVVKFIHSYGFFPVMCVINEIKCIS